MRAGCRGTYLSVLVVMSAAVMPWYTSVSFHTGFNVFFRVLVRSLFACDGTEAEIKMKWGRVVGKCGGFTELSTKGGGGEQRRLKQQVALKGSGGREEEVAVLLICCPIRARGWCPHYAHH